MTFEIDPRKSVLNNMLCDNNINTMNNLCYEISSAYGKVYGDAIHKKLKYKCSKMISDKKKQIGKSDCSLRRPPPPPIFNQIPHYFPSLLIETNNKDIAYKKCLDMASSSRYPNTTKNYCRLDADAVSVVSKENYKIDNQFNNENFDIKENSKCNGYKDDNNFMSFLFYIGVIIMIISIFYIFKVISSVG
jgi:hypothetical protein